MPCRGKGDMEGNGKKSCQKSELVSWSKRPNGRSPSGLKDWGVREP